MTAMNVSDGVASVLRRATAEDVRQKPFPYLIVRNALPEALADRLAAEFPAEERFRAKALRCRPTFASDMSNRRIDISAADIGNGEEVSQLWKSVIDYHTSPAFLADFAGVFGPSMERAYPAFERTYGRLAEMNVGLVDRDEGTDARVLLDASIGINTPVTVAPSRVRGVHVDRVHEIFAGLLYLRHPNDDSTGGSFEIHRFKGRRGFLKNEVPPNLAEKVDEVAYEHNTFVIFLNTIDSLHAVSPRSITPFARRFMIVAGIFAEPLIDHTRYQIGDKPADVRGATKEISAAILAWRRLRQLIRIVARDSR